MAEDRAVDRVRVDQALARGLDADDAARLSSVLSLLSDAVRVRILYALDLVEELCVGDLALALELSEDAVGYALRLLRTAGFVQSPTVGRGVSFLLADTSSPTLVWHRLRGKVQL